VNAVGTDLARRFRDVAGLTGLVGAWVRWVERRVSRYTKEAQRAVLKLLGNVGRPEDFFQATPHTPEGAEARLHEGEGSFFYQEARRLLREAGAAVREGEDGRGRFLLVSREDLERVYAHLEGRYPGQAWRGFVHEVYESVAAMFPQYIGEDVRVWALERLSRL
jgi:hypothetical protein